MRGIDGLGRDVRDGARSLARRPAFTAVAVVSLALGIGANTAIFSLVNAIILRDSPIERPEEVVNLYLHQAAFAYSSFSYPDFEDVRDGTTEVFSDVAATQFAPAHIDRAEGGGVGIVPAEAVTGNYFPMLGIEAALGRTLLPSDDVSRGGHPVVMLDYRYWQTAFAGDPDVVGREMRVGGRAYTVVGVGPPEFTGTTRGFTPTFYAPYMMVEELVGIRTIDDRGNHALFVKARLRPGVALPEAESAVGAVAAQLTRDRIENWDPAGQFAVLPLTDVLLFPPMDVFIRAAAWLLMAVVALVLLLACTNLASFLLARALDRRKEIAVRLALGASRGSLVRRLLTETTLLGLLAGGAGTGLAVWLLHLLATVDLPLPIPVALDLRLDGRVLAFTLGVSLVAGALLGLVPALQSTRPDVSGALRSESAGGGQPGQLRWRNALVVAQLTISLVLLVGAGLFLRSFQQAQSVDLGFGREPTAILTFLTPATRFAPDEARVYTWRLLDRFRELPGVEAVGAISRLHLNPLSTSTSDFNVAGFEPPGDHGAFIADRAEVDPGFFEAAGIEIVRGRNFSDADRPDTQPVVIISEAMARRFWEDGDAVGRLVRRRDGEDPPWLVVGVAADAKVRTLGEAPRHMVYLPYSQRLARSLTVVARTSTDLGADGARAPDRGSRGRPRPVGVRDEDDGRPPRADAAPPAALRLRAVRLRGAGAGRHRPLRRGQPRRLAADARDRHPHGARRRRTPRRAAARRGRPQAGGRRRRARAGARRRRGTAARRAAVRSRHARPTDVRRRAARPRRRRPPGRLATGPPRQPRPSGHRAPDQLTSAREASPGLGVVNRRALRLLKTITVDVSPLRSGSSCRTNRRIPPR